VRVTFTDKDKNGIPEVQSENHYYPFGMPIGALSYTNNVPTLNTIDFKNEYFYNGKEAEDDFGLGWLDYGARMYDPVIGRFWSIDPLAEWHFNFTPYNYCLNNPINFIDPFGLDTVPIIPPTPTPPPPPPPDKTKVLPTVVVKGHKPNWLERRWHGFLNILGWGDIHLQGNSTYKSGSDFNGTMEGGGGNENAQPMGKTTSEDITAIMYMNPGGSMHHAGNLWEKWFNWTEFTYANSKNAKNIVHWYEKAHEEAVNGTSDKDIGKNSMGNGEKTDSHGQAISNKGYRTVMKSDKVYPDTMILFWDDGKRSPDTLFKYSDDDSYSQPSHF
jgi:RHS repeat-associated protein